MNKLNLTQYIFENRYKTLKIPIIDWLSQSSHFMTFVIENKDKIRSKVRTTTDDLKLDDVLTEIRIAFLLLCNDDFQLKYEFYGKKVPGPDFHVIYLEQHKFNIDVKNIQTNCYEVLFHQEIDNIRTSINQIESPFYYGIEINLKSYDQEILTKLQYERENIIRFISAKAKDFTACRCLNEIYKFPIEPFGSALNLLLLRPFEPNEKKQISQLASSRKIPFTQKEFLKFGYIILESAHQWKEGLPNFIFIYTNNCTHWKSDMLYGLEQFSNAIQNKDGHSSVRLKF